MSKSDDLECLFIEADAHQNAVGTLRIANKHLWK